MWIAANTNVRLLSGVPLDPTNDHTIYFSTMSNQTNYFMSKTKYNLSDYVYQRYTKGSIRVQKKSDDLYDCNYIMFQNSSFGNKWFYGFITDITYINNDVSEITYEIDDLQTWWFDFLVDDCWIDREHSATDNIGDNTIPENIETGEFIRSFGGDLLSDYGSGDIPVDIPIIIISSLATDGTPANGAYLNGIYSGLYFYIFRSSTAANDYLSNITNQGKSESVVAIIQVPEWFIDCVGQNQWMSPKTQVNISPNLTNIDGYIPKNKKLFTAQFNSLLITDNNGNFGEYSYERFRDISVCFPNGYNGDTNGFTQGINDCVKMDVFPTCPYIIDSYRAWLAQNKGSLIASVGSTVLGAGISAISGNLGGEINTITEVGKTIGALYDHKRVPPTAHQIQSNCSTIPFLRMCFSYYYVHVKAEYARIIDNFFTRFGYKTNRLKKPNMNVRENFCYTRTIGCTITGDIPGDAAKNICNIYNNGITFWKNPAVIGDYTVSNNPV